MVRSLGLMLIVIFAILWFTSSRRLIQPSVEPVRSGVTDTQQLLEWHGLTGRPALLPTVPSGWRINAATMTGRRPALAELHVGWVSPDQGYLGVDQGLLPVKRVVATAVGAGSRQVGTARIAGSPWQTWRDRRGETFFVETVQSATVVVAGSLPADQLAGFAAGLTPHS